MRMLHFAPEPALQKRFREQFGTYETADIARANVDHQIDMRGMATIPDSSFDIVVASHVLEHIKEDHQAIREVARVPGARRDRAAAGADRRAEQTIEYPRPVPTEFNHVRRRGPTTMTGSSHIFGAWRLQLERLDGDYQTWAYGAPVDLADQRPPVSPADAGPTSILDAVPVCFK